jgi:SWI/SNF related-matrix-associated actin-dependent regulator of chromatin subfamily C
VKAKAIADMEERRIKGLVAQLIDAQLKRIDIKLKHFDELETMLDQEHQKVRTSAWPTTSTTRLP